MDADILIKNGLILTMDGSISVHENSDIAIKDGEIIALGKLNYKAKKTINANNMIVMPGLINTHSHAAMTLLRGAGDDLSLDTWLKKVIFPLEAKYCKSDFVRIGTELAIIEMIKSGTTTFSDLYFFEDEVAQAASKIGMRAVIAECIFDFESPNTKTPDEGMEYVSSLHKKWGNNPLINIAVGPHAPYTCSEQTYKKAKTLSDKLNIPIHTHLSETFSEVSDMKQKTGKSPVKYLEAIGLLSDKLMAAHCVHVDHEDIKILHKHDVKILHCAECNMKLASGSAPIVELIKHGITIGLGTDGAASNNNLDMFDEMDITAKLQKLIQNDPSVMDAKTVLKLGTINGAKVLGKKDLGSLEIGKAADIILIDLNSPQLTPMYNPFSHTIYSAQGRDVHTVIINGKLIMENRKILTANEQTIIDAAIEFSKKIKKDIPNF